jgi:hypothetical protein
MSLVLDGAPRRSRKYNKQKQKQKQKEEKGIKRRTLKKPVQTTLTFIFWRA